MWIQSSWWALYFESRSTQLSWIYNHFSPLFASSILTGYPISSMGLLEYANCIYYRGLRLPSPKKGVFRGMTLNCIWFWRSEKRVVPLSLYYSQVHSEPGRKTCQSLICGSNRLVLKLFVFDRNIWYYSNENNASSGDQGSIPGRLKKWYSMLPCLTLSIIR